MTAARPAAEVRRPARRIGPAVIVLAIGVVLAVMPFYLDEFWLRTGFAVFGAAVGAIGLNILVGTTGQLSLGHAFFLAVGAISYCWLAGEPLDTGARKVGGLGLPPLLAMVLAVGLAGLAGLLFSPVAARLKGIYLGVASLGLVFVGQHVLNSATTVTGGFNGRSTPDFELFGFAFADDDPNLYVLDVPFDRFERLWYLGLVLLAVCYFFARGMLEARPGRALRTLRDSEIAAAVNGVDVTAYRAKAFLLSSMYAGLSGVLYALSIGSVAPESFTIEVSIQYLAMIVLGGLGSVGGAVVGAAFVSALPLVLDEYSESIPGLAEPGSGGVSYAEAARYAYGAAVIAVVIFWPAGLAGVARRLSERRRRTRRRPLAQT
jgi:branched-chain amino acid transport system permease protein